MTHLSFRGAPLGAAVAVILNIHATTAAQNLYNIVELGTIGDSDNVPTAISNAGHVVGYYETGEDYYYGRQRRAVLWYEGEVRDLGTFGGSRSEALAVNSAGHVVGWAEVDDVDLASHAFLWLPEPAFGLDTGLNDLGTLGGNESWAWDINEHSQVVGVTDHNSFLWLPGPAYALKEGMNPLCSDPYYYFDQCFCTWGSDRMHLNDLGEVVGGNGVWLPAGNYGLPPGWSYPFRLWPFDCADDSVLFFAIGLTNSGLSATIYFGHASSSVRTYDLTHGEGWGLYEGCGRCGVNNVDQFVCGPELSQRGQGGTVLRVDLQRSVLGPTRLGICATDINDPGQIAGYGLEDDQRRRPILLEPVSADFDSDDDSDLRDYALLLPCLQGPEAASPSQCLTRDLDEDEDVDLVDAQGLFLLFTGER